MQCIFLLQGFGLEANDVFTILTTIPQRLENIIEETKLKANNTQACNKSRTGNESIIQVRAKQIVLLRNKIN